jgi:acyl carrier protein
MDAVMSDRLTQTYASVLNVPIERLTDASSPANTPEWDSLATINITLAVEREFGLRLSMREVRGMSSIGLAKSVLRTKGVQDL